MNGLISGQGQQLSLGQEVLFVAKRILRGWTDRHSEKTHSWNALTLDTSRDPHLIKRLG